MSDDAPKTIADLEHEINDLALIVNDIQTKLQDARSLIVLLTNAFNNFISNSQRS